MNWSELINGPPLRWIQPSMIKMHYQLVRGGTVIATLRFKSLLSSLAIAENDDGCWTFKRTGFFQTQATIRVCTSDSEIGRFRSNWRGGGTLEFPGGRHILGTTNLWQSRLEFQEASGESLMRFKYDTMWGTAARVDIDASALGLPETSWMVAFGWYLQIQMQNGC